MLKVSTKVLSDFSDSDRFSINTTQTEQNDYSNLKENSKKSFFLPDINEGKKKKNKRSSSATQIKENDDSLSPKKISKSKSNRYLDTLATNRDQKIPKTFIKNRNTIRLYNSVPTESMPPLHITNQEEVKKKFFTEKVPPFLKFKADNISVKNILTKHNKASFTHFFKAKHILDIVKSKFPSGLDSYFEANFGKRITSKECVNIIGKYLLDNKIQGDISINFAPGLTCSGRITSYSTEKNKPETRKFSIWINDGEENQFLRKKGIVCLCDHEIGTHYYRSFNDGLQSWFFDRNRYGLRPMNSHELLRSEEGIAALHTLMNANLKFLYLPALLYYLACMGDAMTFEKLYNHMENYIDDPEERWKLVTRVKRGISDPHAIGVYSRDQSYFEGAIEILENLDDIDFFYLMSGKICTDELSIVKKYSKLRNIKLPKFFEDINKYKERLRHIGIVNGILEPTKEEIEQGIKNELLHKEMKARMAAEIENGNLVLDSDDEEIDSYNYHLNENIKDYKELYKLNKKHRDLNQDDVKDYINKEIVINTKSTPIVRPNSNDTNSNMCVIL